MLFMNIEMVAKALKELGHKTRLSIYKQVVKAGQQGISVGDIQEELSIPGSTLSHHISGLSQADLIHQRREGRMLFCIANYQHLEDVIDFLKDECCVGDSIN